MLSAGESLATLGTKWIKSIYNQTIIELLYDYEEFAESINQVAQNALPQPSPSRPR